MVDVECVDGGDGCGNNADTGRPFASAPLCTARPAIASTCSGSALPATASTEPAQIDADASTKRKRQVSLSHYYAAVTQPAFVDLGLMTAQCLVSGCRQWFRCTQGLGNHMRSHTPEEVRAAKRPRLGYGTAHAYGPVHAPPPPPLPMPPLPPIQLPLPPPAVLAEEGDYVRSKALSTAFSIHDKISILDTHHAAMERGVATGVPWNQIQTVKLVRNDFAREGFSHGTFRAWLAQEDSIRAKGGKGTKRLVKSITHRGRQGQYPEMEKELAAFIRTSRAMGIVIQVWMLADEGNNILSIQVPLHTFKFSRGWQEKFFAR